MIKREHPFGAEVCAEGVHFRVWAPSCQCVELLINEKKLVCDKEGQGWFSLFVKEAAAGDLYFYILDHKLQLPDPASFCQPQGITGPSRVFDHRQYVWKESEWKGIPSIKGEIIYEMHIGTFTPEGTWKAAAKKLPYLAELGITVVEMMPVAEFSGQFGWGYDGIFLFAPYRYYGTPDDLKAFIDTAHSMGIGVILDVVYNHIGPGLDLHKQFAECFFHDVQTEWGCAINFAGEGSEIVRQFFITNALYFLQYFHFDGLRFDAAQDIHDDSPNHILKEIGEVIHEKFPEKSFILTAENEPQNAQLVQEYHIDALWNDDFHHSALVALLGKSEGYLSDYKGTPQELLSAIKYGYLYQGQYFPWQKKGRGSPAFHLKKENFIVYLENHDQVPNVLNGVRLAACVHPAMLRALTMLYLLIPQTPLLFQGQEFGSTAPFYFFADHSPAMNQTIWAGRRDFLMQFASFASFNPILDYLDPGKIETFQKCKLKWDEMNEKTLSLYKHLIKLRKQDADFTCAKNIDGAVLDNTVLLLRYFGSHSDKLLLCNFGKDFKMSAIAEPLFAAPKKRQWKFLLSSEEIRFGGTGYPIIGNASEWILPAYSTFVLTSKHE